MKAEPPDPSLPGWHIETHSNDSGRSWKIYRGPNKERENTRAGALRAAGHRAPLPPTPPPVPMGWMQGMNSDGRIYYHNAATGQVQWNPPL